MDVTTNVAGQELVGWERHRAAVRELRAQLARMPSGSPVRLAKRTSNLFRPRATTGAPGLDVSRLDGVIAIDAVARTAQVQGMCPYETLVDATRNIRLGTGTTNMPNHHPAATAGNLASPFTPLEIPLGQACEFNVYHLMKVDSPTALFPIRYEEVA